VSWSIRARLNTWYSALMLAVLAAATVAIAAMQTRTAVARLDAELRRLELTVEGVMREEFGEGLDLRGAAAEASTEVVTPGRAVVVSSLDGSMVRAWGTPLPVAWRPSDAPVDAPASESITLGASAYYAIDHRVREGAHEYLVGVVAPMAPLDQEHRELLRSLMLGIVIALAVAIVGGWLVGKPALRPLSDMAHQATQVSERNIAARLMAPNQRDELGRLATAFNGLLDRLADALSSQRQFMAEASHQLRTPVSVLRTTAEVTLRQAHRDEHDYREALGIVGEQSVRLARLVDAMLLLSRAEAGGRAIHPEPVYLDDLVADSARALAMIAAERQVRVVTSGQVDVPFVGDEELLRQMFMNLLDNAVRHTRSGGQVVADLQCQSHAVIRVADEGRGIPDADRDRIFQRFTRLDEHVGGAGLGLPIARWIAESHGGTLQLESSSPQGSVFVVTLPLATGVVEGLQAPGSGLRSLVARRT
jgi:signal transduction histidine kinase